jgi:NADP-dependent 3-hydroxy acid dehydrogenase YdfG
MADTTEIDDLFKKVVAEWGTVDVLVNNAGNNKLLRRRRRRRRRRRCNLVYSSD